MKLNEKIQTDKLNMFKSISKNTEKNENLANLKKAVGKIVSIDVSEIKLIENIRNNINTQGDEFIDLKNSIFSEGVLQPAIVELREKNDGSDYELIAVSGHRRILACRDLGIEKIKVEIKQYTDLSKRTEHALIENLMREDLHALDLAESYVKLIEHGWNENSITEKFSKNKKYVRNILKIGNWPNEAKSCIRKYPEKFSMRVLCNQFSKRQWKNTDELLRALNEYCNVSDDSLIGERVPQKKVTLKYRKKINEFFQKNSLNDHEKMLIENALKYMGINI